MLIERSQDGVQRHQQAPLGLGRAAYKLAQTVEPPQARPVPLP
jgi:hypothetical protein